MSSGAGGSSYISGHFGCHSYATNPDDSFQESIGSVHYSGISFSYTVFKGGNESFFSLNVIIEKGHLGNGAIKTTFLG